MTNSKNRLSQRRPLEQLVFAACAFAFFSSRRISNNCFFLLFVKESERGQSKIPSEKKAFNA